MIDLDGPVHFVDFGAGARVPGGQSPVIVCIHGLGGSNVNWRAVGPALARSARVLAIDLPGFGRTPLAGRRTGIYANRRLLDRFLTEVVGVPAVLMGNSMGGTIAILEAASEPARVSGLVLVCPCVPKPAGVPSDILFDREVAKCVAAYAVPGLSQRLMRRRRRRLGPEALIQESMRLACVDPGRIPEHALVALLEFADERSRMPWADAAYLEAARSLVILYTKGRRRFLQAIEDVQAPTLFIQGEADRLTPLVSAEQIVLSRPDWGFAVLENVGHLPMLEDPERLVSVVEAWISATARSVFGRGRPTPRRTHEVA
jgi:pimeloyl-ACP methyl ester carboxylesterase